MSNSSERVNAARRAHTCSSDCLQWQHSREPGGRGIARERGNRQGAVTTGSTGVMAIDGPLADIQ
jgi:hypothetical protein